MLGSGSLRAAAGGVASSRSAQPRSVCMRAAPDAAAAAPSLKPVRPPPPRFFINEIPGNGVWPNGVPPVMGAHLMASGVVAPLSTSKGAGLGVYPPKVAYFDAEGSISALLHATPGAAGATLAKIVAEAAAEAIKAKGSFTLVLSGGALFSSLEQLASAKAGSIQWDKVHVFFVDERVVPHASAESNIGETTKVLLSRVPIPQSQVHAITEGLGPREAAVNYEGRLVALPASVLPRNDSGMPVFDLMVLGVGPDGHIASLFPHRGTLNMAEERWVLPIENSPKLPKNRITMSLPVINASKDVLFVALGESKAEVVQRTLEVQALPGSLPAQLVRAAGRTRWLLDVASAQTLDIAAWDNAKMWNRSQVPKSA